VAGLQDNLITDAVVDATMERMNTASSLYQMYREIVDVSFLTKTGYVYYEDVPLAMLLKDIAIGGGGRGVKTEGDGGGGGGGGGGNGNGNGNDDFGEDAEEGFCEEEEDMTRTASSAGNVLHPHRPREFFALGMEWGEGFYGPELLHHSTDPRRGEGHEVFLHPVLRKYKLARNNATGKLHYERYAVVHLAEDLATAFTHPLNHLRWVKEFFTDAVKANKAQVDKQAGAKRVSEEEKQQREANKRRIHASLSDAQSDEEVKRQMDESWSNPFGL
jgi:hypothetical protein